MPKISLVWNDGKFRVELCAADKRTLEKARQIGQALDAMHQEVGLALIQAVVAITDPVPTDTETEKPF